jgi:hypothetical protein
LEIGSLVFVTSLDFKRRQKFVFFAASLRSVAADFESSQT